MQNLCADTSYGQGLARELMRKNPQLKQKMEKEGLYDATRDVFLKQPSKPSISSSRATAQFFQPPTSGSRSSDPDQPRNSDARGPRAT